MRGLAEVKVALATELLETIEQAVAAGDYASPGAVIQAALENWQADRRRKQDSVAELQRLWAEGLAKVRGLTPGRGQTPSPSPSPSAVAKSFCRASTLSRRNAR